MTGTSTIQLNPMDPAFLADPYPTYHRLRAEDPVHQSRLGFWVLTRYEDVVASLRDPRLAKEAIAAFVAARFGTAVPGIGLSMLDRDPPDHTRLRSLVSKAFTPRVVETLRPRIQAVVDDLLARVAGAGSMDLIEQFAYPIPVVVICEMLGVPVEDHEQFKTWGLDIARGLDAILLPLDSDVGPRSIAARRALSGYFRELIARRRASPRADLLSGLIAAEEAGDKLSEDELLATCILLLIAGHETTVNLIGNGTLALLRHPDHLALADRPATAHPRCAARGDALPAWNVRTEKTSKQPPMIRYPEMQQFVDDHDLLKPRVLVEQITAEAQPSTRRARRPLRRHPLDLNAVGCDADPVGPLRHGGPERHGL